MNQEQEKEIIGGYAVENSVWIGNNRFVFGISEDEREPNRYMKCIAKESQFFVRYESAFVYDDYLEAMRAYQADITAELDALEKARAEIGLPDIRCLQKSDLIPVDSKMNISGKVVAIHEKYLNDGFKDISHQLYYVDGGLGVEASSRGRACYGCNVYTGEKTRIERYEIIGIVPDDKIPGYAKKNIETYLQNQQRMREGRERDGR